VRPSEELYRLPTQLTTPHTPASPIAVLPFLLGFSCFYAAISSVSLAGSVVLVTSLVLLVSRDRVRRRLWRSQGVAR